MSPGKLLTIGILILAVIAFNFVPTMLAYVRSHPERRLIGQLNILSLLSFLLWLALLVWAGGGQRNDSVIARFIGHPGNRRRLAVLVVALVGTGVATTAYALTRG